ncbi:hypothetical protein ACHAWU_000220 [Discostella pseudostelligera]|uniref:Uncharacterized protein n=1 Tax=Discostella pseudostelligera TaxID=259834 RepID=A0ABD3MZ47_9STRA
MSTKGRTLLVATPTKREPRHSSCRVELCACHDFQPDTATSAVDSDQQTSSLIRWLSGASLPKIDDERVKTQSNHCPNRLHASIAILNAIRDACRQFLEAPPSVGTSPFPKDDNNKHPNFNDKTYEDSFPSLPSLSSASPPTLLVGRKKNKGPKISSDTNGGGNISNSWNATNSSITANIQSQNAINATKQSNGCHMTASGNATSVSPAASNSPIRQTFNSLTFASESMRSSSPKMGMQFFMDNKICSDGAEKFGIDGDPNTGIDEFIQQKSERLVLIYVAILRSQLAPSLLLEFHLLLRLLSLSDKNLTRKKTDTDGTQPYHDIFHYEQSCRDFAAKTLTDLESVIVNLGHETLKMLVAFPALQMHCRRLCMTMQDIIHAGKSALIFDADRKALGHTTNTPHLTLPFDHARDSRHNYRSAQLNMIFKEREELRDSFLFQLRGFQDIRGRLMEQEQAEKSIVSLQQASREILSSVSPGNTYWFVNFVCDLLLQTGLAPISETDSEVLRQIGDKKRLQKLHMRFTSTNAQTNRSSKTLLIDQRGSLTNTAATPDQSFTGHQEFFSIFIRAGNSYTFNMHFKNRLAQLINEMTAVKETKDLCEYMAKTQMLAKFLGMLDFSPNWELAADSIPDRDYDLTSSINIRKCIEDAWIHNRLVVVIPWVTQYLGMMKWYAAELLWSPP